MQLKVLGSDSSGNCYVLQGKRQTLLLEAGINIAEVKRSLDFDLSTIVGTLITHEHGDHFKYTRNFAEAGITLYGSKGTFENLNHHRVKVIPELVTEIIGEFKVIPFRVKHDAKEPYGYYIWHEECGNTLFLTDSFYTDRKFNGLNNILLEANYDLEVLNAKFHAGGIDSFLYNRITKSHMSIQTAEALLLANDLSKVNNIVLIHLSNSNSNEQEFKKRIIEVTGKTVHIADKNKIINLNKYPF